MRASQSMRPIGLIALLMSSTAIAQSVLPQGGKVTSGQATIGATGNALTVTQNSNKAVVDWNSFSVGVNNSVTFVQPSSSAAILNRVTGSTTSTIAGQISANGQVFLVNPNGIFITPTGTVQTGGGFVASTLGISDTDFNNGYYNFTGNGASGVVSNAGTIGTGEGGYVALLGGTVSNAGSVSARLGKVGLGSGEHIILNPSGDGFLQVAVPTDAATQDGRALIDVSGRINAAGGEIQIKAASAKEAARDVINVSGNLSARTVSGTRGNIMLGGGEGGVVTVTGAVSAKGGRTQKGGTVAITGNTINLRSAKVNTSGGIGGGTINIGGGWQGSGALQRAATTFVDANSLLRSDATVTGNGGNITVWSDGTTTFAGFISAQGGPNGGNGGNAEVSGKTHLALSGDYSKLPLANLKAPLGETGNLLFDPGTVLIVDQAALNNNTALNGPDTFTAQFISSQLASANVTISTNNATGANGSAGDINLLSNAQVSWSSNSALTLSAARDINFAAGSSISGTGATSSVVLRADSGGTGNGTINFNGGTQVNVPTGTVDLYYNPSSNRTVANGGTNNSAGTVNGTSFTGTPAAENWSTYITAGVQRAWMLVNNVFDLQNIANNLSANFSQGKDIDASATAGWNSGAGFIPLGTDGAATVQNGGNGFTGTFDGAGKSIDGLSIDRPLAVYVGLFGYVGPTGSIANTILTNAAVTGKGTGPCCDGGVGALAGESAGTISNTSTSGSVSGEWNVGGLIGMNTGTVVQSSSSATVQGIGSNFAVGGLVGWNTGSGAISNSYATGSVTSAGSYVGGFVGTNDASISDSYATGAVSGLNEVGGLVGNNTYGAITRAYATGTVTGNQQVGGLVGVNGGTVTQTYASGATTGNTEVGGLVGNNSGTISSSFFDATNTGQSNAVGSDSGSTSVTSLTSAQAFTQANYTGFDFTNTWWMQDNATRPLLRSEYSTTITNAHQLQLINMSATTLAASYTLRGSIDVSDTNGGGSSIWTTSGFVPIGTDVAGNRLNGNNGFTGSFDGAGHSIDGLYINRAVNYVGLFGNIGPGGLVQNVGVTNATVAGIDNVGALAGHTYGTILNSFSSGSVSSTSGPNAGGLVGGQISGTIDRSYSTASVSGASTSGMGGLLGTNNAGTVSNSYATGSANSTGGAASGGLVGANINGGIINRTYATGSVTSSAGDTGGLVGYNNGSITESYAVGAVSGSANVGGLIGSIVSGSAATSYFDNQTTGQINGVGSGSSAGVTGLSTAVFQNGSLPAGFNPAAWTSQVGQYPQLSPGGSQIVKITATDSGAVYGSAPSFSYSVTDTNGIVLCTNNCAAYFAGTPLIDSTIKATTAAGTSAPGYIASGTVAAVAGYVIQYVNDSLTVAKKALSVTASDLTKVYGTAANLGSTAFTTSGLVNGDTVTSATLTSTGSAATADVMGSPYAIVASNASGAGLSNYTITYINGQLTVTPANILVTAIGGSSSYGASPANPGLSATGLQNGQNASVLTGLSNSFGITSTTNAGSYTMSVLGTLTNPNYTVTGTNTGTWTVNPKNLTVTANDQSKSYGQTANLGSTAFTTNGLINGDTVSSATLTSAGSAPTAGVAGGPYAIVASNAAGTGLSNYTIAYVDGRLTVTPAPLTVTALGGTSNVGQSPSNPGLTATGLQNGETESVLTGLSNSFGITNTTPAGSYTMTVAGVLSNPNYTVTTRTSNPWTVFPPGQSASPSGDITGSIGATNQNRDFDKFRVSDMSDDGGGLRLGATAGRQASRTMLSDLPHDVLKDVIVPEAPEHLKMPAFDPTKAMAFAPKPAAKDDDQGDDDDCGGIADSGRTKESGAKGKSGKKSGKGCAVLPGVMNFSLNDLTRNAVFDSVEGAFSGISSNKETRLTIVKSVTTGTTLVVTAGIIGWLLRGGALLSALMSSVPLWREFDPLVIVQRPRRKTGLDENSQVDQMFENASVPVPATNGLLS